MAIQAVLQCYIMAMADSSSTRKPGPKKRIAPKEFSRVVVSPSLLAQIDPNKKTREEFSLGMSEWMDDAHEGSDKENRVSSSDYDDLDDFKQQPTTKKIQLNKQVLSLTKASTSKNRFAECVTTTELTSMTKPLVPKNTQKNIVWALRNFSEWREKRSSDEKCRSDLLDSPPLDVAELNHWLCLYVLETRRSDGNKYPVSTLYALLSGILRHMRSVDPECPNFLDANDHKFKDLHAALDNLGRQLRSEGVGAEVKHASVISLEEEEALWEQGILGCDSPKSLLRAVFYLNGKKFLPSWGI